MFWTVCSFCEVLVLRIPPTIMRMFLWMIRPLEYVPMCLWGVLGCVGQAWKGEGRKGGKLGGMESKHTHVNPLEIGLFGLLWTLTIVLLSNYKYETRDEM